MGMRRLMLKYSYFCLRRLMSYFTEGTNVKLEAYKGKVIKVKRKSRGLFHIPTAKKGDIGLVVQAWQGTMGTGKFKLIKKNGSIVATTLTCIEKFNPGINDADDDWQRLKEKYDEENSIPVIVLMLYDSSSAKRPLVAVDLLHSKKQTMIKRELLPEIFIKGQATTIYLSLWKAEKLDVIKKNKSGNC